MWPKANVKYMTYFNYSNLNMVKIDCPRNNNKWKVDESGEANSVFGSSDDLCEVY